MAFNYIAEEDFTTYECTDCGHTEEEQILMGALVCPKCGAVMRPV